MTLVTGAVVTLVVWAVSLVGSVRVRALIYSLPIPITVVLLGTGASVGVEQVIGVALLNLFTATVAWLYRLRWPILLADLAGVGAYIAGGWAAQAAADLSFALVLAIALIGWTTMMAFRWRRPPRPAATNPGTPLDIRRQRSPVAFLGKLVVIAFGTLLTIGLGGLLRGLVVTFPYSGILVVVETRRELAEFRAHFAYNSLALLAFFGAYHYAQHVSVPVGLAAGWTGFVCAITLLRSASTTISARADRFTETDPVGEQRR